MPLNVRWLDTFSHPLYNRVPVNLRLVILPTSCLYCSRSRLVYYSLGIKPFSIFFVFPTVTDMADCGKVCTIFITRYSRVWAGGNLP
jgi:hypothetical protein